MRRGQAAGFWEDQSASLDAALDGSPSGSASTPASAAPVRPANLGATIGVVRTVLAAIDKKVMLCLPVPVLSHPNPS